MEIALGTEVEEELEKISALTELPASVIAAALLSSALFGSHHPAYVALTRQIMAAKDGPRWSQFRAPLTH